MAIRNWKDIPLFKDVTDEQWNDWHWQVSHRLSTLEDIEQVLNLTDQEREEIQKVIGGFRVGITPYYASLMDPEDLKLTMLTLFTRTLTPRLLV